MYFFVINIKKWNAMLDAKFAPVSYYSAAQFAQR